MNRPENIPFEVWDIAFDAMPPVAKVNYETSPLSMVLHLGFASAIMAAEKRGEEREREACAAFMDMRAEEVSKGGGNVSHMMGQIFRAEATAIRSRP